MVSDFHVAQFFVYITDTNAATAVNTSRFQSSLLKEYFYVTLGWGFRQWLHSIKWRFNNCLDAIAGSARGRLKDQCTERAQNPGDQVIPTWVNWQSDRRMTRCWALIRLPKPSSTESFSWRCVTNRPVGWCSYISKRPLQYWSNVGLTESANDACPSHYLYNSV
jgi:hypothetical protein